MKSFAARATEPAARVGGYDGEPRLMRGAAVAGEAPR